MENVSEKKIKYFPKNIINCSHIIFVEFWFYTKNKIFVTGVSMKKIYFLAICISLIGILYGQVTLEIGNGTVNNNIPIQFSQRNSYSQSIYLASEIGTADQLITSIWYSYNGQNNANNGNHRNWTLWMGCTDLSEYASTSAFIPIEEMSQVYHGSVNFSIGTPGWFQIVLDEPFLYEEGKNLAIAVYKTSDGNAT